MQIQSLADVIWPALLLAARMRSLTPILTGLLLELLILRYIFPLGWKKALIIDLSMNAISSLAGAILIPLAGMAWEVFPGLILYHKLNMGTFNPVTWAATCVMAVFISTGIEVAVVRFLFVLEITRKRFWTIAPANFGSTLIAWISLQIHPPQL